MNKEIIIDGVNVAECKRRIGKNSYCRYFKRPCADNNFNCIWKQQERLKAENQKLKQALGQIREICNKTCEKTEDCIRSCYECKSIDEPVAINRILDKINEVLK